MDALGYLLSDRSADPVKDREYHTVGGVFNLPHALVDCQVEGSGWASFSAWLDGRWVPCFKSYRKVVMGRLLAYYSGGLKSDITVSLKPDGSIRSDLMCWWDPPTCSFKKNQMKIHPPTASWNKIP